VPLLIFLVSMATLYGIEWISEFQPAITDLLPNNQTTLYAIIVPAGLSWDPEEQMRPLAYVLDTIYYGHAVSMLNNNNNEYFPAADGAAAAATTAGGVLEGDFGLEGDSRSYQPPSGSDDDDTPTPEAFQRFQDAALAAAESFQVNHTEVSVASPVLCSFQLYHVHQDGTPPDENDMWTARGVLVQAENHKEAQQLTKDLIEAHESSLATSGKDANPFPPLRAISFGPGPFAHGNHPLGDSLVMRIMEAYWVDSLIGLHWGNFGEQEKFVVMRIELMTTRGDNAPIQMRQHVVMKPDSLDIYEVIYPKRENEDGTESRSGGGSAIANEQTVVITDEL